MTKINSCPHCWGKSFKSKGDKTVCNLCHREYEKGNPILDESFRDTLVNLW